MRIIGELLKMCKITYKMKNILLLLFTFSFFVLHAQRKPKIKGNKDVVEVREALPAFNAIELNDDLEIFLQNSSDVGYNVNADDNLIDVLKFRVEDSTLVISAFYKITSKKKLEITVNYNELRSITMRDGRIRMKDIVSTDHLDVTTFGSSKLELNANAPVINITMEGNSSGELNLDSDSLNIILKDRIDASIYSVSEKNTIEMYKNASVKMEGTTDSLRVNLYENANLKAQKLEAAYISAHLEESSTAHLNSYRDFELTSRGASKTYLYGNPKIVLLEFLDTSELYKRND